MADDNLILQVDEVRYSSGYFLDYYFEKPVTITKFDSIHSYPFYLKFYDENEVLIYSQTTSFGDSETLKNIFTEDIEKVSHIYIKSKSANVGYITLKVYGTGEQFTPLTNVSNLFDNNIIEYKFSEDILVSKNDISIIKDGENIDFDFTVENNIIKIIPLNLKNGDYTVNINKVTSMDGTKILDVIPLTNFNINIAVVPISYLFTNFDTTKNIIEYKFSENISVNENDISIVKNGVNIDFDFTVVNNIIKIIPLNLKNGDYTVNINKVTSLDGTKILSVIPFYDFNIDIPVPFLKLTDINFGDYITSTFKNFVFTYDDNIVSADVKIKNITDNTIVKGVLSISKNNVIYKTDGFLLKNKYSIIIDNVVSANNYKNEKPFLCNFKVLSIIGDNSTVDSILVEFLNLFFIARKSGIKLFILAISIGIIFIVAKWLWNKLKLWLKTI